MAGVTEFYCGWNEPSHASQFKWLEYTFKISFQSKTVLTLGCALTFASEAKFEIEAKISFRLEAKQKPDFT